MNVLTIIWLLACLVTAGVVSILWKMRPAGACAASRTDWLNEFSTERYRPMLRLVDDTADPHWIDFQSSLSPKHADQYRHQRCRILRGYLQEMSRDFERMTKAVDVLIDADTARFNANLRRCQNSFSRELRASHRQVDLYARGEGTVELAGLLAAFDRMQQEMRRLLEPAATLAA